MGNVLHNISIIKTAAVAAKSTTNPLTLAELTMSTTETTLQINSTKPYVPVVTFSKNNIKKN